MLLEPTGSRNAATHGGGPSVLSDFRKTYFSVVAAFFTVALVITPARSAHAGGKAAEQAIIKLTQTDMAAAADDVNDPLEPMNRLFFNFNETFQDALLRPASKGYVSLTPPRIRQSIGSFLDNLRTPVVLANDILQGKFDRAMGTIGRTMVNTIIGVGGLFDVASGLGMKGHKEDFGQTLGTWGVGEGFYLVLPLFGPSSPRDAIGMFLVDPYFDAAGELGNVSDTFKYSRMGLNALDKYSAVADDLQQIKKTSIDYYAAIRSMYRQKRNSEINDGKTMDLPPIPDLSQKLPLYGPLSGRRDGVGLLSSR